MLLNSSNFEYFSTTSQTSRCILMPEPPLQVINRRVQQSETNKSCCGWMLFLPDNWICSKIKMNPLARDIENFDREETGEKVGIPAYNYECFKFLAE